MNTKVEMHGAAFRTALLELHKLTCDETTAPSELAGQITTARESLQIAARRLSAAVAAEATRAATELEGRAAELARQADGLRKEGDHAQVVAVGTVRGLFGDVAELLAGRRSVRCMELHAQADALQTQVDAMRVDAASFVATANRTGPVTSQKITLSRVRELTPQQLAGNLDDLVDAALNGRLVEG